MLVGYMPKTSSGGQILGFKMSKSRGREEKLRQKKAERRKKKKLGNMKTPTFLWEFFLADFNYKTGEKLRFVTKMCPPVGVSPIYIYMYTCVCIYKHVHTDTYIYMLWCYYLGQVWPFEVLLSGPSLFFTKHCLSKTL